MKKLTEPYDELFMRECLALAEKGAGYVSPNPMVGAVIVKEGRVVARSYHRKFGGPHAEVNAIRSGRSSIKGATLYTNLEPCNFFGKTPPCTKLIIASGISKVVVGMKDPNPRVAGSGIRELRRAGIDVRTGVLEDECRKLNEAFIKYITTGTPYVTLKVAQTLDGKIADASGKSKWITCAESRKLVHYWRARYDAVLIGAGTVNVDDPRLTVRSVRGRNPVRVILDGRFSINQKTRVLVESNLRTILFTSKASIQKNQRKASVLRRRGIEIVATAADRYGRIPLKQVLYELGQMRIASVLVEGGATVFSSFLEEEQVDKMFMLVALKIFGKGLDAISNLKPRTSNHPIHLYRVFVRPVGHDILIEGYLHK